ncbi:MAG TPA: hypothetical protein VNG33_01825, partial [Polyangiaceae bacterium]|nr:hypothetical protein [Polyangiaceae bacterium]
MADLETTLVLPPDPLPGECVRSIFELIFERFRWVEPRRFGRLGGTEPIVPGKAVASMLSEFFVRERRLTV